MSPLSLLRRVWDGFRPEPSWLDRCALGEPVPDEDRCRALDCPTLPLTELREGEGGSVSCLDPPGGPAARKLSALGLLPGAAVTLVQSFPVWVVRSGYAEIALDRTLADQVRVLPD